MLTLGEPEDPETPACLLASHRSNLRDRTRAIGGSLFAVCEVKNTDMSVGITLRRAQESSSTPEKLIVGMGRDDSDSFSIRRCYRPQERRVIRHQPIMSQAHGHYVQPPATPASEAWSILPGAMPKRSISVCVPTRNRPQRLARMIQSGLDTAHDAASLEWLFYLDDDDEESEAAIRNLLAGDGRVVRGPRLKDQSYWNSLAGAAGAELIFLGADDLTFRTRGWDQAVRTSYAAGARNGIGMVWTDDGDLGARLATHPFVSRRWIDVVGFFVPPYFERCFVDLWIFELATLTGVGTYLPDVLIEHSHIELGKAEPDSLYKDIRSRPFSHQRYTELAPERMQQAQALLQAAGIERLPNRDELTRRREDALQGRSGKMFVWP